MNKILIGFSAGLLVGILFAPAKGSDTRETVRKRGSELKDKFNDLVDSISDQFETVQDEVSDYVARSRRESSVSSDLS